MVRMVWDATGSRQFFGGTDRGAVYFEGLEGEPWSGLVSVVESTSENQEFEQYVDGERVSVQVSLGSFSASITSMMTPESIFEAMGHVENLYTSQKKKPINITYRTSKGNDISSDSGYQIHLVFNASVKPSARKYSTIDSGSDVVDMTWDISAKPIRLEGLSASAHFVIDSNVVHDWTLQELEDVLYGTADTPPRMPSIQELLDIFESGVILKIIDHGDGTWTAEGPDEAIQMIDSTTFRITWPSAVYINSNTYRISSE